MTVIAVFGDRQSPQVKIHVGLGSRSIRELLSVCQDERGTPVTPRPLTMAAEAEQRGGADPRDTRDARDVRGAGRVHQHQVHDPHLRVVHGRLAAAHLCKVTHRPRAV